MSAAIKAITIRQPWASLIALGFKQMETRSWRTNYRGALAIHAGLAMPCRRGERITLGDFEVERDKSGLLLRGPISHPYRLPLGAIVAVTDLFQIRSTDSIEHRPDERERSLGDHSPGRFAWSLASVSPLYRPVAATGRQGLWDWTVPDGLASQLRYPALLKAVAA